MIQDIEEESKTKFSMDVEFSFSFKGSVRNYDLCIEKAGRVCYYKQGIRAPAR